MKTSTVRALSTAETARITCGQPFCRQPATWCETVRYESGSISFFYTCTAHRSPPERRRNDAEWIATRQAVDRACAGLTGEQRTIFLTGFRLGMGRAAEIMGAVAPQEV